MDALETSAAWSYASGDASEASTFMGTTPSLLGPVWGTVLPSESVGSHGMKMLSRLQ